MDTPLTLSTGKVCRLVGRYHGWYLFVAAPGWFVRAGHGRRGRLERGIMG